jgi:hypothetical protein
VLDAAEDVVARSFPEIDGHLEIPARQRLHHCGSARLEPLEVRSKLTSSAALYVIRMVCTNIATCRTMVGRHFAGGQGGVCPSRT